MSIFWDIISCHHASNPSFLEIRPSYPSLHGDLSATRQTYKQTERQLKRCVCVWGGGGGYRILTYPFGEDSILFWISECEHHHVWALCHVRIIAYHLSYLSIISFNTNLNSLLLGCHVCLFSHSIPVSTHVLYAVISVYYLI